MRARARVEAKERVVHTRFGERNKSKRARERKRKVEQKTQPNNDSETQLISFSAYIKKDNIRSFVSRSRAHQNRNHRSQIHTHTQHRQQSKTHD